MPAVGEVLTTIEHRDWSRLELLLDPAVHWTTALEESTPRVDPVLPVAFLTL